jgi:RimJ/RimL family protein N-acetyltransferase
MTTDARASGTPSSDEAEGDGGETYRQARPAWGGSETFVAPSLRARHVYLRPLTAGDYPYLQRVETSTELAFRWRLRGATPSPEQWAQTLWHQVLAQYLVVAELHQKPIGLVTVYRPNFQDGHAYLSAVRFERARASPLMILGVSLFVRYVFTSWNFRKLYMELPEFNLSQFESGLGRYFELEGRLRDHFYFAGRYWDQLTLAIYREVWEREGSRLDLARGTRSTVA